MSFLPDTGLWIEPVFLHLVNARFGDFYAGLWHLVSALEHLLPLIGIGLLFGQQSPGIARSSLQVLAVSLFFGNFIGNHYTELELATYFNTASFIVIGGLVAIHRSLKVWLLICLAFIFGFTHGFGNGTAISEEMSSMNFILGATLAGFTIVSLFAGLTLGLKRSWEIIAIRAGGSWIAAIGLIYIPMLFIDKT